METSRVTDPEVLAIWPRIKAKTQPVPVATSNFRGGQYMRIGEEKMKFVKVAEYNFNTEIFRIVKVIDRRSCVFYELEDLNDTPIDAQFYP